VSSIAFPSIDAVDARFPVPTHDDRPIPVLIIDTIATPYPYAMLGHWCDLATWQLAHTRKHFQDASSPDPEVNRALAAMIAALAACEKLLAEALTDDQRGRIADDEARLRRGTHKPRRRQPSRRGVAVAS
jgi:hypothetical protein